jgi:hypothetical protein
MTLAEGHPGGNIAGPQGGLPRPESSAAHMPPGLDLLRTQMQETGSIATGVGFPSRGCSGS